MPTGTMRDVMATGSARDAARAFFEQEARNFEKIRRHELGLTDEEELPQYFYQEYPLAMYPADGDPVVVRNEAERDRRAAEGYVEARNLAALQEDSDSDSDEPEMPQRGAGGRFMPRAR